jgi:hypothetical protein
MLRPKDRADHPPRANNGIRTARIERWGRFDSSRTIGALWFNEFGSGKIGRIATDGAVTEYSIPIPDAGPVALAMGPDGTLWFPVGSRTQYNLVGTIGRITTAGVFTFYNAPEGFVAVAAGAGWRDVVYRQQREHCARCPRIGTYGCQSVPARRRHRYRIFG